MKKTWIGPAAAALLLVLSPGRVWAQPMQSSAEPRNAASTRQIEKLGGSASAALRKGDTAHAIDAAEAAVRLASEDAQLRVLLGRAYFAAGRFVSAEAAFGDALALDPSLARAQVLRAFAQIALRHDAAASESLAAAGSGAPQAEVGLALALLGRVGEARDRLLAASRVAGADARSRQNLAFVYALEGRWNDAAAVAAQDVPADQMPARLRRWAMIAQLRADPAMQIGALMGILPALDAGQPAALALVRAAPAPRLALAAPKPEAAAVTVASAVPIPAAAMADAPEAAAMPIPTVAARARSGPPRMRKPSATASQPASSPEPMGDAPAGAAAQSVARTIVRPAIARPSPATLRTVALTRPSFANRRWVVQLGAYRSERRPAAAWAQISAHARYLDGYVPIGSSMQWGSRILYRLSIGDFASRAAAVRLCARLKAGGGSCFVRGEMGDRPIQWTLADRPGRRA